MITMAKIAEETAKDVGKGMKKGWGKTKEVGKEGVEKGKEAGKEGWQKTKEEGKGLKKKII